jgi:uncharacterized RDD family membrane protein YckC
MAAEPESLPGGAPNGEAYPPADLRRRFLARVCDALLAALPFALFGPTRLPLTATLCAAAILLCNDGLFGPGRSLGKRLLGLRVIVLRTRQPGDTTASMRRNLLFAVAILPAAIGGPRSIYWALAATIAMTAIESAAALGVLQRDLGKRRLGDLFAGTQVIDASIALGLMTPALAPAARPAAAISATQRHAA